MNELNVGLLKYHIQGNQTKQSDVHFIFIYTLFTLNRAIKYHSFKHH